LVFVNDSIGDNVAMPDLPMILATRGSALALAQANLILAQCQAAFPTKDFRIKVIKTTGDKLQMASLASANLPKGLFTKELELALIEGKADLAVHSLKDLPTDLPSNLVLGAISKRGDVRDVLIYRRPSDKNSAATSWFKPHLGVAGLPPAATIATSSTRRAAQLREHRPDLRIVPIRGNVPTRLKKLTEQFDVTAIVLALAGLDRLHYQIDTEGRLSGPMPSGGEPVTAIEELHATRLALEEMLPCVGQGAIGIEMRKGDGLAEAVCKELNHFETFQCATAERAFLQAMGGGCQLAVAAHAKVAGNQIHMEAVSFLGQTAQRSRELGPIMEPEKLAKKLSSRLSGLE
jgi:porphobilinogen deaminase